MTGLYIGTTALLLALALAVLCIVNPIAELVATITRLVDNELKGMVENISYRAYSQGTTMAHHAGLLERDEDDA